MATPVFIYKGFDVSFRNEQGSVTVNATEMAKAFDSRPADWLRSDQSERFIKALSNVRNCTYEDLVIVKEGSPLSGGGTWMHEDVALEFARWLSPSFAIWCNDRIKELLKVGMTALPQTVEAMLADPDLVIGLATQLKAERQRVESLTQDVVMLGAKALDQEKALEAAAPKVLFADCVTGSEKSILVADLAKILKQNGIEIGQNRLFIWLRDHGYLCSKGAYYNRPTQKAMELGLFEVIERTIGAPDKELTTFTTKVTGKGQLYFVNKFLFNKQ